MQIVYIENSITSCDTRSEINRCLSCPYPESMCSGDDLCGYRLGEESLKDVEEKINSRLTKTERIRKCVKSGMNRAQIADALGFTIESIGRCIAADVKAGMLTREESDRSRVKRRVHRRCS